jgi:hypothetical protein
MTRSVQEDVFFSVRVTCQGVPTLQWTFMSGAVSRSIGSWQPDSSDVGGGGGGGGGGSFSNITADYVDRVETYANGSLGLARLRLADAGFYVLTVTEDSGSSKDSGFVLKVNGTAVVESGVVVVSVGSSGPPGGVGRRARRLERPCPREPGTGSGSSGARFPRIGLRSRSLAVMVPDFLPACCSARTFQIEIQSVITFAQYKTHLLKMELWN